MKSKKGFSDLLELARTMRTKNEWHRRQTLEQFSKYISEEAAEIREAIRKKDWDELQDEIGDLMWDLAFLSQVAKDEGLFSIHDSITSVHAKIRRRNPHIFEGKEFKPGQYEKIKRLEKMEKEQRRQNRKKKK